MSGIDLNRHVMKSSYQPNFIKANIIVYSFILLLVVLFYSIDSGSNSSSSTSIDKDSLSFGGTPSKPPAKRYIKYDGSVNRKRTEGFNGQFNVKYRIIPDDPINYSLVVVKVETSNSLPALPDVVEDEVIVSDYGIGDYDNLPYFPDNGDSGTYTQTTQIPSLYRLPDTLKTARPEYPMHARDANKWGIAWIKVLIDTNGKTIPFMADIELSRKRIKREEVDFLVVEEKPVGFFFGKKAGECIRDNWVFLPARDQYGNLFADTLIVRVEFRLPGTTPPAWFIREEYKN